MLIKFQIKKINNYQLKKLFDNNLIKYYHLILYFMIKYRHLMKNLN